MVNLTKRETEVLDHLAHGKSNKTIARDMCLSQSTVNCHVGSLIAKFGAENRWQVVVKAREMMT